MKEGQTQGLTVIWKKAKALIVMDNKGHREHPKYYGTPVPGSKTEFRGKAAHSRISKEILQLCGVIEEHGIRRADGKSVITFGELFNIYIHISNKVVGVLLRARKHKIVDFEGETLFQGRDDKTLITLHTTFEELKRKIQEQEEHVGHDEFTWGSCM